MTSETQPGEIRLTVREAEQDFALVPDATARARLAEELGLLTLRKLRFEGRLAPEGERDWHLIARLGATVVQPCVVTLSPVTTRIDTDVERRYLAEMPELPEGDEIEMPEDDTLEPMPEKLDLMNVLAEALALALPDFPRAEGVEAVDMTVTEPGKTPITEAEAKPFAGLKSLRERLENPDGSEG